ncbi:MAG: AraC family transcriptional regulator [Deltaproteobacteria bacterium]|nr:AraC family transcriptional regulator [Deltaproteobacteria bacterium]
MPGIVRLQEIGHREVALPAELHDGLPAFVQGVGFQAESNPGYSRHGLQQGSAELALIQYTLSGRGRLRFEDREMLVEPGQAMLLHLPHDHCYRVEADERWEFFYVRLGGPGALAAMREAVAKLGPVVEFSRDASVLARAVETCAAALDGSIESASAASEMAYGIVMALLSSSAAGARILALATNHRPKFVAEVEEFCRLNLMRPIGVNDMARVANMSRFHFTRMFERARGISPGRYLAGLRLEESLRLIARGGHTVKRVAEECGYGDANYFCKVFRKSFGVSPGAFRTEVVHSMAQTTEAGR